jgi:predicted transcriptional regulator
MVFDFIRLIAGESFMSNKELVLEAVRGMPDEATIEEISEEIAILAAIRRGQEAVRAGDIVSHDEVKQRLSRWNSK